MNPMRPITIAVDFDGTLFESDEDGALRPVPGAAEALAALRAKGVKVIIHTCRIGVAEHEGGLAREIKRIESLLRDAAISYDGIFLGEKLVADLYVDDRAVAFRGSWPDCVAEIDERLR